MVLSRHKIKIALYKIENSLQKKICVSFIYLAENNISAITLCLSCTIFPKIHILANALSKISGDKITFKITK